jgi:hypothetical protein
VRFLACAIALCACAPAVDGPVEHQRAVDRDDSARLAAQLAQLPGTVHAEVTLHRPVTDPLTQTRAPAGAAIVLVVDDHADRAALVTAARDLAHATAPEIPAPAIAIELGAVRPELAEVGPFTVEAHSKRRLQAVLAIALAAIAMLASWIAWRERQRARGSSAQ